jgi:hypothetical protein
MTLLVRGLHSMQYRRPSADDWMKSKHSCQQCMHTGEGGGWSDPSRRLREGMAHSIATWLLIQQS